MLQKALLMACLALCAAAAAATQPVAPDDSTSPPTGDWSSEKPDENQQILIRMTFLGDRAAHHLKEAYAFFRTSHPDLLEPVEIYENTPDKVLWHYFVEKKIWPKSAAQIISFPAVLSVGAYEGGDKYIIPNTTVDEIPSLDIVPVNKSWAKREPSSEERRQFCRRGWRFKARSSGEPDSDCIVQILRQDDYRALSVSGTNALIKRISFRLKLNVSVSRQRYEELQGALFAHLKKFDSKSGTRVYITAVPISTEESGRSQQLPIPQSPASTCLSKAADKARKQISWPFSLDELDSTTSMMTVIDSAVTEENNFEINARRYWQHPALLYSDPPQEISAPCNSIVPVVEKDLANFTAHHSLAVASVVFGNAITFQDGVEQVSTSGYFRPGAIHFTAPYYLGEGNYIFGEANKPQVVVLPFDMGSSSYLLGQDDAQSKISVAATVALATKAPLVISAPQKSNSAAADQEHFPDFDAPPADVKPYVRPPYYANKECMRWPACMGPHPSALVVAGLDENGKLLEPEKYVLGSSVVAVAAPGANILTALPYETNPKFGLQSGSSFAAPMVAAIVLAMQGPRFGRVDPKAIAARISATADFDVDPKLVRFGKVNAMRALTGMEAGKDTDVVWSYDSPQTARSGVVQAPKSTTEVGVCNGIMDAAKKKLDKGNLRFFVANKAYSNGLEPNCVSLSDVLRISKSVNEDGTLKNDAGEQLYTVVYWQQISVQSAATAAKKARAIYEWVPMIRRDVVFHPTEGTTLGAGCSPSGEGEEERQPCLYFRDSATGKVEPLNLEMFDVVASMRKKDEPAIRF